MAYTYRYRSGGGDKLNVGLTGNEKFPVAIEILEDDDCHTDVFLTLEEIDRMIEGLRAAKQKILTRTFER